MPTHPEFKNSHGKEIDLTVYVYTRPNLRADEMFVYVGIHILRNLFDDMKVSKDKKLNIMYPERWLNILEQRAIYPRIIALYPDVEEITITTHSVYIIQCTHNGQIGICDKASEYPEKSGKDLTVRFCPKDTYDGSLRLLHM